VIARAGLRIDQGDPTLLALDVAAGQGERGEEAKIPGAAAEVTLRPGAAAPR
jgi:hypothetical protein